MRFGRLKKWNADIAAIVEQLKSETEIVRACSGCNDVANVWLNGGVSDRHLQFRLHDGTWRLEHDGPHIDPSGENKPNWDQIDD